MARKKKVDKEQEPKDMEMKDAFLYNPATAQMQIKGNDIVNLPIPYVQVQLAANTNCDILPPLQNMILVGAGEEAYATQEQGRYYVFSKTIPEPTRLFSHYTDDLVFWTTPLSQNGTDSATMDAINDCGFYPVANSVGASFNLAWIESDLVGKLNLKFASTTGSAPQSLATPPVTAISNAPQNIFIYPNQNIYPDLTYQNIPLSDVTIVDVDKNEFDIPLTEAYRRGLEVTMPSSVDYVRFTQSFTFNGTIKGQIITVPDGTLPSKPIGGVTVNIYRQNTNVLVATLVSDSRGNITTSLNKGIYWFEIGVNSGSFLYTQAVI